MPVETVSLPSPVPPYKAELDGASAAPFSSSQPSSQLTSQPRAPNGNLDRVGPGFATSHAISRDAGSEQSLVQTQRQNIARDLAEEKWSLSADNW